MCLRQFRENSQIYKFCEMKFFIFLLLNLFLQQVSALNVSNVEDIIKVINDAVTDSNRMEKTGKIYKDIKNLVRLFNHAMNQVWEFGDKIDDKSEDLMNLMIYNLDEMSKKESELREVSAVLIGTITSFDYFMASMQLHEKFTKGYRIKGLETNDPTDLIGGLKKLHEVLIPYDDATLRDNFVTLLNEVTQTNDEECGEIKTPRTNMYDIYSLTIGSEIREYFMVCVWHSALQLTENTSHSEVIATVEAEMIKRIRDYTKAFSKAVEELLPTIHSCDPSKYKRGVTFEEFMKFRTKYITNQWTIDIGLLSGNGAADTCEALSTPAFLISCDDAEDCKHNRRCQGPIQNCLTLKGDIQYCESHDKRYLWMKDGNGETYGKFPSNCHNRTISPIHTPNICVCDCYEDTAQSISLRSISFREQIADVDNNKVVTGIKFHSSGSMIQIHIQQGELSHQGYVKSETLMWLPLELIEADHIKTRMEGALVFYITPRDGEKRRMIEQKEFGAFTVERDKINLDYLVVPKNYIITGVRCNYPHGDEEFGPIQLEIHITQFNFFSGKLIMDDDHPSKWITPDDMKSVMSEYDRERSSKLHLNLIADNYEHLKMFASFLLQRKELVLSDHLDDPRFLGPIKPRSEPNSYIRLQTTSLSEDIGQTVLPLIDLGGINGDPSFGLGAINLLYKASEPGGAGFISFAVEMVDPFNYLGLD